MLQHQDHARETRRQEERARQGEVRRAQDRGRPRQLHLQPSQRRNIQGMRGKDEREDRPEVQTATHRKDRQTLPMAQSQVHGGELQGKHQARGPNASQELLFRPEQQRHHPLDHRIKLPDCLGQHGEGEVVH